MLRKDYIMRMYEEFGKFLGTLFGLRKMGNWPELEELIKTSAQKYSLVELEFAESLETKGLPEYLMKNHSLNSENLKMLGDLLYEKGLMYLATDRAEAAKNAFQKVFVLYTYVQQNALESDFSLDMHNKLSNVKELLGLHDKA